MSNRFIDHGVVINGNYRHFKGNTYTVFGIATNTETDQMEVIYGNDGNRLWARPLEMFLSEVDHEKYPNADQKMRLEYIPSISDEKKAKVYDEYIKCNGPMYGMNDYSVLPMDGCDDILIVNTIYPGQKIKVSTDTFPEGWENNLVPLMEYLL